MKLKGSDHYIMKVTALTVVAINCHCHYCLCVILTVPFSMVARNMSGVLWWTEELFQLLNMYTSLVLCVAAYFECISLL